MNLTQIKDEVARLDLGIEIVAAMKASIWNWNIEDGRMDALSDTETDRLTDLDKPFEEHSPEDQKYLTASTIRERERLHKQALFAANAVIEWFNNNGFTINKLEQ